MSSKPTLGILKDLIPPPSKKTAKPKAKPASSVKPIKPVSFQTVTEPVPLQPVPLQTVPDPAPKSTIASVTKICPNVPSKRSSSKSEKKSKIGSYSSAEFQNWLNTPIQKPKMKRSKKTNDDAYQVFQDFSDMVDHVEWKAFFQKLYTGKFPHGYSYRNQTLFFRKRTKIEKLEVLDSTKSTLYKVMSFFTTYGGYSNQDDDINIFDFVVSQTPQFTQWKEIRSKKTKQFYIQKYVDELAANHELSNTEKRILVDTIHTGFLLKTIDNTDIEFENKKIVSIRTLTWDSEKREFEIPRICRNNKNSRKNASEKIQRNSFASHWNKFVHHILKSKGSTNEDLTDISSVVEDLTDTTISMSVVSE